MAGDDARDERLVLAAMTRAYSPRQTTVDLMAEILALDGVATVRAIAPHRSGGRFRSGGLRITLEPQGANPKGAHSDFTLPEARRWLAAERDEAAR